MKRRNKLNLLALSIGVSGFFILPSWLKSFAFFIPLFIFCFVYKSDNDNFNMSLFLILGTIFFLLPCQYFTFDAKGGYATQTLSFIVPLADIFSIVIFLGLPVFLFICAVIAIIRGNMAGASNALIKLLIIIIFIMIGIFILDVAGIEVPGVTRGIFGLYSLLISIVLRIPIVIIEVINWVIRFLNIFIKAITGVFSWFGVDTGFDAIPEIEIPDEIQSVFSVFSGLGSFDAAQTRFNAMDQEHRVFAMHNSLPLLLSIIIGIFAVFSSREKWHLRIIDVMTKMDYEREVKERAYFPNMDYKLIVFIVIILIAAFGIYLSYANAFRREGTQLYEMFSVLGFFSIYLFLSIVPLILMNFSGLAYYKDSNIRNTLKGTIFGLFGLFIIFQLMNSDRTLSAMSLEQHSGELLYILNTFIFVAPSESLMFHIFLPALVMGIIASYSGKKAYELGEYTTKQQLILVESQIMTKKEVIKIYESFNEKKLVAKERANLNELNKKRSKLADKIVDRVNIYEDTIFGRPASVIILIVFGMLSPSFIFATFHFWASGIDDYVLFWTSGLGVIYFCGSVWFIFIGLRYGWLSAVLTHAFHNTITIMLVIIFTAG